MEKRSQYAETNVPGLLVCIFYAGARERQEVRASPSYDCPRSEAGKISSWAPTKREETRNESPPFDLHVRLSLLFDPRSEKDGFRLLLDCARKHKKLTLRMWRSVITKMVANCLALSQLAGVIRTFDFTSV
jgi:hypothetical protein